MDQSSANSLKKQLSDKFSALLRRFRRLLRPSILKRLNYSGEAKPRLSQVPADLTVLEFSGEDDSIMQQLRQAQSHLFTGFEPHHRVMIKINLNTAGPYPASTDPKFLLRLVELLREREITNLIVADCSSVSSLPTSRIFQKTGISSLLKGKATLLGFDSDAWVRVPIAGEYLKELVVPRSIYEVDRIIYLTNLKSHQYADFSMSMKHAVGLMHPYQRFDLHKQYLQEKTVEISLAVQPDLIILDARKAFITGSPNEGEMAEARRVFAGKDLLSVDLAGYDLLYRLKSEADCLGEFKENPYQMRQFGHAQKIFKR